MPLDPADQLRLHDLRRRREEREAAIDTPEPTVELILDRDPDFANKVRERMAEIGKERRVAVPVMTDASLLDHGVAVAKSHRWWPDSYGMLGHLTADEVMLAPPKTSGVEEEPVDGRVREV